MRFIDKIRDFKDEHKTEITICKIAGVVILGTALCCYCKGHMDGMDAYRRIVAANPDVLCKADKLRQTIFIYVSVICWRNNCQTYAVRTVGICTELMLNHVNFPVLHFRECEDFVQTHCSTPLKWHINILYQYRFSFPSVPLVQTPCLFNPL